MATPTPLQRKQTGYRLPAGEWFNTIIDRVNALIAGTVNVAAVTVVGDVTVGGNAAITGDLTVDDITADDIACNDFFTNGITTFDGATLAAAGATQGDATQITTSTVYVTATTSAQGVILPVAAQGKRVTVFAPILLNTKVYPATGDAIGAGSLNSAVVLAAAKGTIYQAIDGTTWAVVTGA